MCVYLINKLCAIQCYSSTQSSIVYRIDVCAVAIRFFTKLYVANVALYETRRERVIFAVRT